MKYLIFGLGNIGYEYKETRHNVGFKVLDALAYASNIVFEDKRYGARAEYKFKGRNFILIKPSTYMNRSGKAINYYLKKEKLSVENSLIIVDDIALPFGTLRLRAKGGPAGHNGLIDIIETMGHQNFPRLRFGIGNDFGIGQQVDYVLGEWTGEEKKNLPERIDAAIQIIKSFGTIGLARTMNQYNNK
ncbi:MAG: aminoacyl-tRNA hydrolase [Marinilabiliales bacterium]|nr:MAG: aminoacyl-tRNA hydrolase [Marinilabiliales bacterium]